MKTKLLISGATGNIGSYFLNFLNKKKELFDISVVLRNKRKKNIGFNIKKFYYLNDNKSMQMLSKYKFDYAILIAGYYENSSNFYTIDNLISSNITIPTKIIEQIKFNIQKIIYLSTFSYLGPKGVFEPINLYSATKKNFEDILYYYYSHNNFSVNILYLYETYSENDKRYKFFNIIKDKINKNEIINLVSKNFKLNFIHFEDLSKAICSLFEKDYKKKFHKYSIKGQEITLENLMKLIINQSNNKVKLNYNKYSNYNLKSKLYYYKNPPGWSYKNHLQDFIKKFFI
jgi:nucleoside-diphosphate-sugar epimerase